MIVILYEKYIKIIFLLYIKVRKMTEVINMTPQQKRNYLSAKYYSEKINSDEEFKAKERERIRAYNKSRYETDPQFQKNKKEQALQRYYNKKQAQKQFC